uniref:Uncharacterized protein n=1 Tax=Arundo donax TaxID=35708 RepID=A0A0A9AZJ9_ARUDO
MGSSGGPWHILSPAHQGTNPSHGKKKKFHEGDQFQQHAIDWSGHARQPPSARRP